MGWKYGIPQNTKKTLKNGVKLLLKKPIYVCLSVMLNVELILYENIVLRTIECPCRGKIVIIKLSL